MRKALGTIIVTLGLACTLPAGAGAFNGGHDPLAIPSGGYSFTTHYEGEYIGPWYVTSGSIDLVGEYWEPPYGGGGSIDLNGNERGGIAQTLDLPPGSYVLSFALSANPDGGDIDKQLEVRVGDSVRQFTYSLQPGNTTFNMRYNMVTVPFQTSGETDLVFTSLTRYSPYGPVIGDIRIEAASSSGDPFHFPL